MINKQIIFLITILLVIIYPIYKISTAGKIHDPYTIWTKIKNVIILNKLFIILNKPKKKKLYTEGMKMESDIIDKLIAMAKEDPTYDHVLDSNITTYDAYTTYNNFYELGTGKADPSNNRHLIQDIIDKEPWTLTITYNNKPNDIRLEDLLNHKIIKDNIIKRKYKHRCVEGWRMTNLEYIGFECKYLIEYLKESDLNYKLPLDLKSKFIQFETVYDPDSLPGQKQQNMKWPYKEGLRMDEAIHPLTMIVIGFSNRRLPPQNGAPIRLVVPWKYGIKSIKSISKINFVDKQPETFWSTVAPQEYGFYANVNPKVDHPRWSQATDREIGAGIYSKRQKTEMYNGYGKYVAKLYEGMDLNEHF